MLRQICQLLFIFYMVSFSILASAAWKADDYILYEGDYNSDGLQDFVLFPHRYVFVSGGGNISMFSPTGATPIVLQKIANIVNPHIEYTFPSADIDKIQTLFNAKALTISNYKMIFGDLGGNGTTDIILQPLSDYGSLIVLRNDNGITSHTFNMTDLGYTLVGSNSVILNVSDGNLIASSELYGKTSLNFDFSSHLSPKVGVSNANQASSTNDALIGDVPYTAWVDVSGASRYQVPIRLPSGINQLQPNLSLNYNSNRRNGALGVGWGLTGLSSIRRCTANLAEDGFTVGIGLNESDRYCLNGQKLISVSGADNYGAVGNTYKTEMESFQKIVSVGGSTGNPDYWLVTDSKGNVWYYGENENARLTSWSSTASWFINRVKDIAGNDISYTYDNVSDLGMVRIKSIKYAGTQITFSYEQRSDFTNQYYAGKRQYNDKRLTAVNINNITDNSVSFGYKLSYDNSIGTGFSRLNSLTLCGTECVESIRFSYKDQGDTNITSINNLMNGVTNLGTYELEGSKNQYFPLNINGDGFSDFIKVAIVGDKFKGQVFINQKNGQYVPAAIFEGAESKERQFYVFDVNGDGLDDFVDIQHRNGIDKFTAWYSNGHNGVVSQTSEDEFAAIGNGEGNGSRYKNIDANGDGYQDLIDLDKENGVAFVRTCINAANGLIGDCKNINIGSWDKVGDPDKSRFMLIDTNSDGLLDIFAPHRVGDNDGRYNIFINNGNGAFIKVANDMFMHKWHKDADKAPTFLSMDVNSDGLVDVVKIREESGQTRTESWLNTGKNEFIATNLENIISGGWTESNSVDSPTFQPLDINHDGAKDLLHIRKVGNNAYLESWISDKKGNFTPGPVKFLSQYTTDKSYFTSDTNGDGILELVEVHNDNGAARVAAWSNSAHYAQDKLIQAKIGSTITNAFDYGLSSNASVYQSAERPVGVVRTSNSAKTLTTLLQYDNGLGALNQKYYRYYDLKTHNNGLGSLGYARIEKFDLGKNIAEVSHFNQDWQTRRYASLNRKEICALELPFDINNYSGTNYCQANISNLLERESHQWTSNIIGKNNASFVPCEATFCSAEIAGEVSYHVVKTQSVYEKWGGANDPISNRLVDRSYDINGNLTKQTSQYGTGSSGSLSVIHATEQTDYKFDDSNLTGKHIFKPTSISHTVSGAKVKTDTTNTTSFKYDGSGRLTTKISEPGKDNQIIETYSSFDRGLPTSIKRAWLTSNTANSSLSKSSASEQYQYDVNGSVTSKLFGEGLSYSQAFIAHPLYDVQSSYTDINGQTTTTEVDVLGRVTKVAAPQYTSNYEYKDCSGCGDNARYYVYKTTTAQPSEKQYYDTLGRVVKSEKQILSGAWSQVTTEYNPKGQVTKVSEPSLGTPSHFTTYVYDNAGRTILENKPAGDHSIAYSYNGLLHTKAETFSGGTQTSYNSMNAFGLLDYGLDAMGNKTQYFYNGRKQLVKTIDVDLNEITIEYDVYGNRTKLVDPDKGTWTFTNNAFGLVASENNGNGDDTIFSYDLLGRMTSRTNSEGTSTWQYDKDLSGIGQINKATQVSNSGKGTYVEDYSYDGFGNLEKKVVNYGDGQTAEMNWHYVQGKLDKQTFPGEYAIRQVYNSTGYLSEIQNYDNAEDKHWQAISMDARGNLTGYKLDGTLTTTRSYDAATGFVQSIKSGWNKDDDAQLSSYTFDSLGNLKTRDNKLFMDSVTRQANQRTGQSFTYDVLNRLAKWNTRQFGDNQDAIQTLSMSYAANGNINIKPDVGDYTYGEYVGTNSCASIPGPHAVSYIEGKGNYCYDQSGNMLSGDGKTLTYTSFDKPKTINKNGSTTEILYGPSLGRYKRIDTIAGETQTTWYLDGLYEKILDKNSKTTERFYLGDFGLMERTTASNGIVMDQTRYFLKDHIGSVLAIAEGNSMRLLQEFHYDVWGKREFTKVYADPSLPAWDGFGLTGRQGFTGHEMLDNVGLIHMNGRVYDPELGRFVSADPYIQAPNNSQSFNRYSYVWNNPLSFIDPSGFVADVPGTDGLDIDDIKLTTPSPLLGPNDDDDDLCTRDFNPETNKNDLRDSDDDWVPDFLKPGYDPADDGLGTVSVLELLGGGAKLASWGWKSLKPLKPIDDLPKVGTFPDPFFSSKSPSFATPGTKILEGQHINNRGRVEPWKAHYDDHGRQIGRTDYNAGNKSQNIPDTHYHAREYNRDFPLGHSIGDHIPGEYTPL